MNILLEKLESNQRDIGLIINEVKESDKLVSGSPQRINELRSALNGMKTVARDMEQLAKDAQTAIERWDFIHAKKPHKEQK